MVKKVVKQINKDNEIGARKDLLEQLFHDFHKSRKEVYWLNFVRGIFFGVGSLLGGTIVIALVVWLLSWLTDIPGGFGDFIQYVVDTVQNRDTK